MPQGPLQNIPENRENREFQKMLVKQSILELQVDVNKIDLEHLAFSDLEKLEKM